MIPRSLARFMLFKSTEAEHGAHSISRRVRPGHFHKFEARMDYVLSFRLARAISTNKHINGLWRRLREESTRYAGVRN